MIGLGPRGAGRLRLSRPAGFAAASVALAMVFLASGTPIPLYNTFRMQDGITDRDLAITTVAYLAMTAVSLLVLGRLSDHLGRKPVALAAVGSAVAGLVVLMNVHGAGLLMLGRMLQGVACGLASSALGSWAIDLAPARPRWLPALVTGAIPPAVLPVGALVSGALAEYGPAPRTLMFTVVAVALVAVAVPLALGPQPAARRPGVFGSLVPRLVFPHGQGRLLFAVGAALVATWSFSGFYQAFSPAITADHLGTANRLVIAIVFSSIVVLAPIGGLVAGRMRATAAVRLGLIGFSLAAIVAVMSLHAAAMVPFLAGSYLGGVALGMVGTGGMSALLAQTAAADRAGLLASVYLISYTGAAVPNLVGGELSAVVDLLDLASGYIGLVVSAAAVSIVLLTRSRPVADAAADAGRVPARPTADRCGNPG
ncbi:MFS transporter [Propionicicella superfundia]|uniref:MFS transporter n=1 Tax=Propionicicella superfundia TaxID=348582 RepID=UPI0006888DFF|nr:MFS transporter [Propionicicella superfundia]